MILHPGGARATALSSDPSRSEPRRAPMASPAFVAGDFKIFDVKGFKPRMSEIRARVRPKLDAFGDSLSPSVGRSVGGEVFAHVARHARRTVNPADDTRCA